MKENTITKENERLLTRAELATRWSVSQETIKRRQQDGTLSPVYLEGGRLIRYRLSQIVELEK